VAKDSPLLKDAVLLGDSTSKCEARDAACFSSVGRMARCQNVLVGSSAAKGNGYVLSVRIFEWASSESAGFGGGAGAGDRPAGRRAGLGGGQACRALQVKCVGRISVDADRRDMTIYVDNRLAPRTFKTPEVIAVEPASMASASRSASGPRWKRRFPCARRLLGDHLRASDGEGGLPLSLASDLRGERPPASVDVREGKWTKPVGYTLAGAGIIALGSGSSRASTAKSLINQAESNYRANGAYLPADVSNLNSASSAATIGNVLLVSGAVLLASGSVLTFAF